LKYFFYKKTQKTTKSKKTTRKKKMATQQEIELAIEELATKCLENGLIIEDIPISLKTEKICINALKWGLQLYKTNDYTERREICFRILKSIPDEILLTGFVTGHLTHFV
jgi:hypothetical protein